MKYEDVNWTHLPEGSAVSQQPDAGAIDIEKLKEDPSPDSWKELVRWAYSTDSEGARRIYEITGHYLKMRSECEELRKDKERLDKALQDIVALRLNPYCMTPSPHQEASRAYEAAQVIAIANTALRKIDAAMNTEDRA